MTDPVDLSNVACFLDAVALVNAQQRHDEEGIGRILDSPTEHLRDITAVLGQWIPGAIRTQGITVQEFLDLCVEKAIKGAEIDAAMSEGTDDGPALPPAA